MVDRYHRREVRDASTREDYRYPYAETVTDSLVMTDLPPAHRTSRPTNSSQYRPPTSSEARSFLDRDYPHAPPPASHRSEIGTNSYMDYDTDMLDAESAADTKSVNSSISQRASLRRQRHAAEAILPPRRRQGEDAAPEDYYRPYQDRLRLRAGPVRPPRTFSYELEPEVAPPAEASGRRSPPRYRTRSGTYQEISPSQYGMVLSNPVTWTDSYKPRAGKPDRYHPNGNREEFTRPFVYETGRGYAPPADDSAIVRADRRAEHPAGTNAPTRNDRTYSPAPRSRTQTDLRQYSAGGGQVVELRTPSGTTIRIVEDPAPR